MTEPDLLIELYVERHPREAAAIMNVQVPADAGAVLDALDPDHAAVLLGHMATGAVAACIETLPPDRAAYQLGNLPTRVAAAVLRQTNAEQRSALLHEMPAATRIQVELMMRQPSHRVGAWIETRINTVEQGRTADVARQDLAKAAISEGDIYLVDSAGGLQGVVSPTRLFGLRANQPVDVAARPAHTALHASDTIEAALAAPAWEFVDTLPVVDRAGKLLGDIRQSVLRRALAVDARPRASKDNVEYMNLADSLYVGLASVLASSISRPPQVASGPRPDGSGDQ